MAAFLFIEQCQVAPCPTQAADYEARKIRDTPPPFFLDCLTRPLSTPVLGASPGFETRRRCVPRLWHAATLLLPLAARPAILENLTAAYPAPSRSDPLSPERSPKTGGTRADRSEVRVARSRSLKGEAKCAREGKEGNKRQGEQLLYNTINHLAALGHDIKAGIHRWSLKSFG